MKQKMKDYKGEGIMVMIIGCCCHLNL